jgi:hypothetical protein
VRQAAGAGAVEWRSVVQGPVGGCTALHIVKRRLESSGLQKFSKKTEIAPQTIEMHIAAEKLEGSGEPA